MAYKDILVVLDDTTECDERVNVALRLAERHQAHLIGLLVIEPAPIPTYAMAQLPPEVMEMRRRMEDDARARVRQRFERQAGAGGVPFEWHTTDGDAVKAVSMFSRHADLAVIGQENPDRGAFGASSDLAENVVLASGRPVLIVPYVGTYPHAGRRVMVAWDASREAARAVADALPVLQEAESVVTISANPGSGPRPDRHGDLPGADIARHLARHGVNVEVHRIETRDVSIANMLLNRIADESIDLLVMGAYGHARVREIWLGGVTRDLLRHMTVPVLVSH